MSETILRVRFRCLQEPQMTNSPCKNLTLYLLFQVGLSLVGFWCPTALIFFNSLWKALKIKDTIYLDKTYCFPDQTYVLTGIKQPGRRSFQCNSVKNEEQSQVTVQTLSRAGPILKACVNDVCSVIHDKLIRTWIYWGKNPPHQEIRSCHHWIRCDTSMHFKKCIF